MTETISSRTPEGEPNVCPVCQAIISIEPSAPSGDAPCPQCGTLLWFVNTENGVRYFDLDLVDHVRERIKQLIADKLGKPAEEFVDLAMAIADFNPDSLDMVELVMELEGETDVNLSEQERKVIAELLEQLFRRDPDKQ